MLILAYAYWCAKMLFITFWRYELTSSVISLIINVFLSFRNKSCTLLCLLNFPLIPEKSLFVALLSSTFIIRMFVNRKKVVEKRKFCYGFGTQNKFYQLIIPCVGDNKWLDVILRLLQWHFSFLLQS